MKEFLRFAVSAAIILAVSACVYPFEPEIEGQDSRMVVDGDIHVGSTSTFYFSRVYPLDKEGYSPPALRINGYIEGEDGSRLEPINLYSPYYSDYSMMASNMLYFDTTNLPAGRRYRLHFEDVESGEVYESDWLDVCAAPTVDDMSYILDNERGELNVALSMHCNGHSHFRWSFTEEWEFHTEIRSFYYYEPSTNEILRFPEGENTYYCWSRYESPEIKIFSTADQTDDRFVDLEFHRIPRNERRLQMMYHIIVHLEAMEEDAYKYWQNVLDNSQGQGTIFSPTPSQMPGNIHCISNPSIPVIGYISAAAQATGDMYYDNEVEDFYLKPYPEQIETVSVKPNEYYSYYRMGYAPLDMVLGDGPPGFDWAPRRCVDCRANGGTKNKPAGWPNDHK